MTDKKKRLAVVAGSEIVVDVLIWDEGWDFDRPACILRPIVRFSPNGDDAEQMVENLGIDLAVGATVQDETEPDGKVDRLYRVAALKRRWAANRRGVEFPRMQYTASRWRIRFVPDTQPDADAGALIPEVSEVLASSRKETRG